MAQCLVDSAGPNGARSKLRIEVKQHACCRQPADSLRQRRKLSGQEVLVFKSLLHRWKLSGQEVLVFNLGLPQAPND